MRIHPEIAWLINRWNLPENEAAITQIEKLLESERKRVELLLRLSGRTGVGVTPPREFPIRMMEHHLW